MPIESDIHVRESQRPLIPPELDMQGSMFHFITYTSSQATYPPPFSAHPLPTPTLPYLPALQVVCTGEHMQEAWGPLSPN